MSQVETSDQELAPRPVEIPIRRWMLAVTLLLLNLLDVFLTRLIIARGGREANPIMVPIIEMPGAAFLLKTVVCVGVGALLFLSPLKSKSTDIAVAAVIVLYTIITGWNLGILLQAAQV